MASFPSAPICDAGPRNGYHTLTALCSFSVVVAGIVNTLGWLGARLLWVFSTAGIIIGAAFMLGYTYKEMSGWEDLAGFLAFSLFSCAGFALGLLAEGIRLLYTRASKS